MAEKGKCINYTNRKGERKEREKEKEKKKNQ